MEKTKTLTMKKLMDTAMTNATNMVCVQQDGQTTIADILEPNIIGQHILNPTLVNQITALYMNSYVTNIEYHDNEYSILIFNVDYNEHLTDEEAKTKDVIRNRANAVATLFDVWTHKGYNKRNAKSPFSSKIFMKYLDGTDYIQSDYVIVVIPMTN